MRKVLLFACAMLQLLAGLVVMTSCSDDDEGDPLLLNEWVLVSYGNETNEVVKEANGFFYSITFHSDGTFSGRAYANELLGEYKCTSYDLHFLDGKMSLVGYINADPDKFYIEHLHDVYRYSVSDKELRLYYSKDEYFKFRINNPKGDDVKLMVMNNNLPEHLMLKGDLPIWMAEKVESAEAANLEGADNDYFYYQFQWMGQQHYMIRSGYSITVYTVSGSEEIFDLMDLFGSSRDWKIIYRVAPPEECGTMH